MVHFMHRNLAYLITILIFIWWWKAKKIPGTGLFKKSRVLPFVIVLVQMILGIIAVLNAASKNSFLWIGIAHQFAAMLLLLALVLNIYLIRNKNIFS